jgi:hypothetical protein
MEIFIFDCYACFAASSKYPLASQASLAFSSHIHLVKSLYFGYLSALIYLNQVVAWML